MTSSLHGPAPAWSAARIIAVVVSSAGIVSGCVLFALLWASGDGSFVARLDRIIVTGSSLALLGLALLIAWKAGHDAANVSMALALTFVFGGDTIGELLVNHAPTPHLVDHALELLLFYLGAALYIRAAQLFPRPVTAPDVVNSRTVWGRNRIFRTLLVVLLRPGFAWIGAALLTLIPPLPVLGEATRLTVILIGVAYMYVTYRSGDEEASRKVLWFFEAALAALLFGLIMLGIRITLGPTLSASAQALLSMALLTLYSTALVVCIAAAVFYAGAVSPALVVRKTMVYGITVALLLFTFATVQAFVTDALTDWLGVTDRLVNAVVGTVFGVTFHPLTKRTERVLRRFQANPTAPPQEALPLAPHSSG